MIYKEIAVSDFQHSDIFLLKEGKLEKRASVAMEEIANEAKKFIDSLEPTEEKFYCLVVALGAGEYWGPNRNGDYFKEEDLIKSYKTFEEGHVFRLHENKDPNKALGRVLKAFWNDRMKRVELILEVDRVKAHDILNRLMNNETVDVSMGCKVEYDVCSVCGHKSRTRAEYCDHLKYSMKKMLPDGTRVYAINPNPKFFDISFVRRGADPTAKVLLKVAEDESVAAMLPKQEKVSEMHKEIPAEHVQLIDKLINKGLVTREFILRRPMIGHLILNRILSHLTPEELLSGALSLGLFFKPEELGFLLSRFHTNKPEYIAKIIADTPVTKKHIIIIKKHIIDIPSIFEAELPDKPILAIQHEKTAEERIVESAYMLKLASVSDLFQLLITLITPVMASSAKRVIEKELVQKQLNRPKIEPRNTAILRQHGNIAAGMLLLGND